MGIAIQHSMTLHIYILSHTYIIHIYEFIYFIYIYIDLYMRMQRWRNDRWCRVYVLVSVRWLSQAGLVCRFQAREQASDNV